MAWVKFTITISTNRKGKYIMYLIQITDTFGDDLNFSWVKRYLVDKDTIKKAVIAVSKHTGRKTRLNWSIGQESARYDVIGNCIAYDVQWVDDLESIENLHYTKL